MSRLGAYPRLHTTIIMSQSSLLSWLTPRSSTTSQKAPKQPSEPEAGSVSSSSEPHQDSELSVEVAAQTREQAVHPRQPESQRTTQTTTYPVRSYHHRPLPPQLSISPLTHTQVPALKRLSSTLLPISYSDRFFTSLTREPSADLCLLAYWTSASTISSAATATSSSAASVEEQKLVGALTSTILILPTDPMLPSLPASLSLPALYISILGILAPYRELGLASTLLDRTLQVARDKGVKCVCVHVWEANEDAKTWYEGRGFVEGQFLEKYYSKLRPGGAWVLWRDLS